MKVELIKYTPDPDKTCAAAALSCHSEKSSGDIINELTDDTVEKILNQTISKGHHSVIEHASFTFSVRGVSRSLTHQLVRHRIASYSQQSQRYVKLEEPTFITPPTISRDKKSLQDYKSFMNYSWDLYKSLINRNIPKEDARFVLPNATTTNITITMNARELIHFFKLRTAKSAQWEIRTLAKEMLKEVKKVAPIIFKKYNHTD
ncbi:FAD-dependent thymidylate synthase [Patescibacteria group bacterium]|nr:FAD-dependent thymidylate synthase [Patescibacteria group bacterium]